jgi:hypothetical protein
MGLSLLVAGCSTVTVNGFSLMQGQWEEDRMKILQRSAFDLSCPKEQLTLTVLDAGRVAHQIGVEGCSKKATYVRAVTGEFVMNNASTDVH